MPDDELGNNSLVDGFVNVRASTATIHASRLSSVQSKLLRPQRIEFVAAKIAESVENIDRAIREHFAQFKERFLRGIIGFHNPSPDLIGFNGNLGRGLDTHATYLREQTDESGNIRFFVL